MIHSYRSTDCFSKSLKIHLLTLHMSYSQRQLHCQWFPTIITHSLSSAVPENVLAFFKAYLGHSRIFYHFLSICHSFSKFMTGLLSFIMAEIVSLRRPYVYIQMHRNQTPSPHTLAALAALTLCGPTPIPMLHLGLLKHDENHQHAFFT